MRTKILQKIRSCCLVAVAVLVGVWNTHAYDYTGYDYVNTFTEVLSGGSIVTKTSSSTGLVLAFDATAGNPDGALKFAGSNSNGRINHFLLSPAASFGVKAVVEFDFYTTVFAPLGLPNGIVVFRDENDKDVFTVYNKGEAGLGITAGPLYNTQPVGLGNESIIQMSPTYNVAPEYTKWMPATEGNAWYHIKAEIAVGDKIDFTVTGITEATFSETFSLPFPADYGVGIGKIIFCGPRAKPDGSGNAGNWTWETRVDNLGIKNLDATAESPTSVTVDGPTEVALGSSMKLTANVFPTNVPTYLSWTSTQGLLNLTPDGKLTGCTVAPKAGMGLDTIVVASIINPSVEYRHPVEVVAVKVDTIIIGGRNRMPAFYTNNPAKFAPVYKLTATVGPDTAFDKTFAWSSSSAAAEVTAGGVVSLLSDKFDATGVVVDTIKASSTDGGFVAKYPIVVDSMGLTRTGRQAFDYRSYDFVDLFKYGPNMVNGSFSSRGGGFAVPDNVQLKLLQVANNGSFPRRGDFTFSRLLPFSHKAVVEFDYRYTAITGLTEEGAEAQLSVLDADQQELFTLYHVNANTTQLGVVTGPLYTNPEYTDKSFTGTGGDSYWASRRAGSGVPSNRRNVLDIAAGTTNATVGWTHVKATIDVVGKSITFNISTADVTIAAFTLPLPADYKWAEGISRLRFVAAGTGVSGTNLVFDDRIQNLALKNIDEVEDGKLADSVSVTQAAGSYKVIAGKNLQLRAEVLPYNTADKSVTWTSGDEAYATVDEYGVVKGYELGADSTVTIYATAVGGAKDSFDVKIIRQPVTGITLSGQKTYFIGGVSTGIVKALIAPAGEYKTDGSGGAYNKALNITTASGDAIVKVNNTVTSANGDTVTINVEVLQAGFDTLRVVAADGEGASTDYMIKVVPNPLPGYDYIELFNDANALNGTIQGLQGGNLKIDITDLADIDDKVLKWSTIDRQNGRASTFYFTYPAGDVNNNITFTKKVAVEFDWYCNRMEEGAEGQFNFMNSTGLLYRPGTSGSYMDTAAQSVFGLYNTTDTAGFGVYTGPVHRAAPDAPGSGSNLYSLSTGHLIGTGVEAKYRAWVKAPARATWYHVKAELFFTGDEKHMSISFASAKDTIHVVLPIPDNTPMAIGQMMAIGTNGHRWEGYIDDLGVRNADADPDVAVEGVRVTSAFDKLPLVIGEEKGTPVEVSAAVLPFKPTGANNPTITWSVSDAAKVRFEPVEETTILPRPTPDTVTSTAPSWRTNIYGLVEGDVWVIATAANGVKDSTKLTILPVEVDYFVIKGDAKVSEGHKITLATDSLAPVNASSKRIQWTSSHPAIATVHPDSGIVTGVKVQSVDSLNIPTRDSVTITATAYGGYTRTFGVWVEFTRLTQIDMYGAKRIFYTANPAGEPKFTVTPVYIPATASKLEGLEWSSTDNSILTVTDDGEVTLMGGYGKAAVKVHNPYWGVDGYYYIEVAAESPYTQFTDFEDKLMSLADNAITSTGTGSVIAGTLAEWQQTQALQWHSGNQVDRTGVIAFTNPIAQTEDVINLRFDAYLGLEQNPPKGAKFMVRNSGGTVLFGLGYERHPNADVDTAFYYFTGGDYTPEAARADAVAEFGFLNKIRRVSTWYTIDLNIDIDLREISFTIMERDNPANMQVVNKLKVEDATWILDVKDFHVASKRVLNVGAATGSVEARAAIDNLGYRSREFTYSDITFDAKGGKFADGTTEPKVENNTNGDPFMVPEVTREGHDFDGWYYDEAYTQPYAIGDLTTATQTLYAKWIAHTFTVKFAGEGISIPDTVVDFGTVLARPADPVRKCYNFVGWYPVETGGSLYLWGGEVRTDLTLYGRWNPVVGCEETETGIANSEWPNLQVYPNPAVSDFVVTGLKGGETITVVNVNGSKLLERVARGEKETLSVGILPQGVYLITVSKGNLTKSLKLFVSK